MDGWGQNPRGVSYMFGHDVISEFLEKHDLELICRAHQVWVWIVGLWGIEGWSWCAVCARCRSRPSSFSLPCRSDHRLRASMHHQPETDLQAMLTRACMHACMRHGRNKPLPTRHTTTAMNDGNPAQVVEDGYEFQADRQLVTLFSAVGTRAHTQMHVCTRMQTCLYVLP